VAHRTRPQFIRIGDALADKIQDLINDRHPESLIVGLIGADLS
jgi:hypothetical protein